MRIRLSLLFIGVAGLLIPMDAVAQEPASTPEPGPAQAASQSSTPDIDAFREPGSTAKLFPAQTPSATPSVQGQGPGTGNGRRNNALVGNTPHRRNGRANDLLADEADADPLEVRVAYRRAKTTVMVHDPRLADLLREAAESGTEVQKRAFLKEYYTRLFAEVRQVDRSSTMRKHVELLSEVCQQRYDPQRRAVGGEEDIVRGGGRGRRGRGQ